MLIIFIIHDHSLKANVSKSERVNVDCEKELGRLIFVRDRVRVQEIFYLSSNLIL